MIQGAAYGVALNDRLQLDERTADFQEPPYGGAPRAPVLYIKPRNCFGPGGAPVPVPAELAEVEAAPTIALLFARDLAHAEPADVRAAVGGACLILDVCEPHQNYYRPAIRERCRDGFLPFGAFAPLPARQGDIVTSIDGQEAHSWSLDRLARPIETLCAEISRFMTLQAGDLLLVGLPGDAPRVRIGQTVSVRCQGLPSLTVSFAPEAR